MEFLKSNKYPDSMLTDAILTKIAKQKFLSIIDATVACFTCNRTYFVQGKISPTLKIC